MKRLLYILGILFLFLLYQDNSFGKCITSMPVNQSYITTCDDLASLQQKINQLEISKSPNVCLQLARRNLQPSEENSLLLKTNHRFSYLIVLLQQNKQQKTSEIIASNNNLNYASLRNRTGHVYALRKIII